MSFFERVYKANKIRKATIRQNRPIASDKAKPRIAYENNCCFRDGFLAYPMMRLPKTVPIPAPEPATPTVAAPAPMNLAAESMSLRATVVCRERLCWLLAAAVAGWTHMAEEAGLHAKAFLEQLVMTMRVMEAIFVFVWVVWT